MPAIVSAHFYFVMDDLILFLLCLFLVKSAVKRKSMGGDFIEIRWDKQPKLFISIVFALCLIALDSLCHILVFLPFDLLREQLDLVDSISYFIASVVALVVCVSENNHFTWKEHPLVKSASLVILLYISVFFLKRIFF